MKTWMFALAPFALAHPAVAQDGPDPVAFTKAGKVQCYAPNAQAKTCGSIATYAPDAGGQIINVARVMLSADPLIVLTTRSPVTVAGGAICGAIRPEDIAAGEIAIGGAPAAPDKASAIKARLTSSLAPVIGKRVCTHYVDDGAGFRAHEIVDGRENTATDQRVVWVRAEEGYRVGR